MSSSVAAGTLVTKAADQKFCFACGHLIHTSATSCTSCGAPQAGYAIVAQVAAQDPERSQVGGEALPAHHVYCRGCGSAIHETAPACPKCGAPQHAAAFAAGARFGGRSRVVAALLALLLGGIGAHKFYLGSIFLGFLYLVFFWTALPALIGLIEGVYYLTLSDDEFARKYGG